MVKTKAERLAQQRLCKKRKYAEIKNDPELYAIEKEKQRAKYEKRKKEKKQTSITEKSPREQRQLRKKWKENSKKYRQNKKELTSTVTAVPSVVNIQEPEESILDETNSATIDPIGLFTKDDLQRAERKIRYRELTKRMKLTSIIKKLQKINRNQKMTIERLKARLNDTNNSNQITDVNIKNRKKRQARTLRTVCNLRLRKDPKFCALRQQVIENIEKFYIDDAVSTVTAGKKEFITKNKRRMQKRYLTAPLKVLHKKLLAETAVRVSYSFFTKFRPFWVLQPKAANRETCLCSQHTNIELLIKALYDSFIIREKNSCEVISILCCDPRTTQCLLRQCLLCKDKVLNYKEFSNDKSLTYFKWTKASREVITKEGHKKKQILTVKDKVITQPLEAIRELEALLIPFFLHIYNIESQYTTLRRLKENLTVSEAVIHVDFSENYSLKFGEEVQSFHFGGSRQQVSLHTSVIYTHDFSLGTILPLSMCSISSCLRHDAPAIWAHFIPLIQEALRINPFITTLHFLSDSPVSQYRNKFMFFIITQIKNDFEFISRITWNYTEAGHGKGAPDGVGAVLKKTADRMVNYGRDVGDFDSFFKLIKENVDNITVKIVEGDSIKEKEKLIPKNLKSFRGTLSIHQVIWDMLLGNKLTLRTVSCFLCDVNERCVHGKHLGFYEVNIPVSQSGIRINDNDFENENVVTLLSEIAPKDKKQINKNKKIKILSDITFKSNENYLYLNQPSTSKSSKFYE